MILLQNGIFDPYIIDCAFFIDDGCLVHLVSLLLILSFKVTPCCLVSFMSVFEKLSWLYLSKNHVHWYNWRICVIKSWQTWLLEIVFGPILKTQRNWLYVYFQICSLLEWFIKPVNTCMLLQQGFLFDAWVSNLLLGFSMLLSSMRFLSKHILKLYQRVINILTETTAFKVKIQLFKWLIFRHLLWSE